MDLRERSRREERELLDMLRAVGGRWEEQMLVTGDLSLVQNWVSGSWWVSCSRVSGQLHSVEAKRKQHWDAVFVQGGCFNLGLFRLWGRLWALCVPAQTSCASCSGRGAPGRASVPWHWERVSVGNGINVSETRKNAAGGKLLQRETGGIL